ncbi:MAG: hypothetical protein WBO92_01090, partial [Candidatus Moraniibacteriota bacterium]
MFASATQWRLPSLKGLLQSFISSGDQIIYSQRMQSEPVDQPSNVIPISTLEGVPSTDTPKAEGDSPVVGDEKDVDSPELSTVIDVMSSYSPPADRPTSPHGLASELTTPTPPTLRSIVRQRLFNLFSKIGYADGIFSVDGALHALFADPAEVRTLCQVLAEPYLSGEKRIAAVIGFGSCGSVLAFGMAALLPPYPLREGETRPVSFLSLEKCQSGRGFRFIDPAAAASILRAKNVLLVTPVLTQEIYADIAAMVQYVVKELSAN